MPELVVAFVKVISLLQRSKWALDPSYFLKCLKQIVSKAENSAFHLFSQHNAVEIISYILEELCGEAIDVSESIRIHIRQIISSLQHISSVDSSSILQLLVSGSFQWYLNSYLKSNSLSGENEFFCNICSSNNQALTIVGTLPLPFY